ncbi:MAG: hypothetical protein NTV79_06305 [Candidatus Aureabacteria bacterium]|nr:hypothetical protein [Candidatus Auribacterota bacterium]
MLEKPSGKELILRLFELSGKPKKIVLQTAGLIAAYFVFLVFWKLAGVIAVDGDPLWLFKAVLFVGWVLAYFIVLFVMTAVAKITLAEVRGTEEVDARAALGAAFGKLKEVIKAPLKIVGIMVGLVLFHVVIDLCGKIPFIGELGWMFSPLITFPLGIALVATGLVLFFGIMLLPILIVLGKEGPVAELIEFLRRNTIKFISHFLIALLLAVIAFVIMVAALNRSSQISYTIMGEKYLYVQSHIPGWVRHVPGFPPAEISSSAMSASGLLSLGVAGDLGGTPVYDSKAERWTLVVAGFVFGILMWLIHMSIWGFILVDFNVAGTLSYLGLAGPGEEKKEEAAAVKAELEGEAPPAPKKPRAKKTETPDPPAEGEKKE